MLEVCFSLVFNFRKFDTADRYSYQIDKKNEERVEGDGQNKFFISLYQKDNIKQYGFWLNIDVNYLNPNIFDLSLLIGLNIFGRVNLV